MARGNPNPSPATRFKKGEPSANPGGVPKGRRISTWLLRIGEEDFPTFFAKLAELKKALKGGQTEMTVNECIARAVAAKSVHGDMFAIGFNAERTEGKVKDVLKLENESRMPQITDEELAALLAKKGRQK